MRQAKIFIILLIAISYVFICGCRSIHVGGSGEVGGAHGSGEVSIPIPKND